MPTCTANGIEINYVRRGEGPHLLAFGGTGMNVESFGPLVDYAARSFDVVAHDQRGLGRTTIPAGPATMQDYAQDAIGLLDHLGWDSCRVIGISFGGMVAQELAVTVPEQIERLALLCTSPGGPGGSSYPLHELTELDPAERAERYAPILDTRFTPDWLTTHAEDRALLEMMAARQSDTKTDEQRRGEAIQLEARRHHDVHDRLGRITCPTFVAAGRFDSIAPLANSEAIVAGIPNAELHVYDGGHIFMLQDRAALPDTITFLAQP